MVASQEMACGYYMSKDDVCVGWNEIVLQGGCNYGGSRTMSPSLHLHLGFTKENSLLNVFISQLYHPFL